MSKIIDIHESGLSMREIAKSLNISLDDVRYKINPEERIQSAINWQKKNPEKFKKIKSDYVKRHPDRERERHIKYHVKNRQKKIDASKKWAKENREWIQLRNYMKKNFSDAKYQYWLQEQKKLRETRVS